MRRSTASFSTLVLLLVLATGCDSTDLLNPSVDATQQAEVQGAAQVAAFAAPSADSAGAMVTDLMALVQPGNRAPGDATCPAAFDLGNGVTGTCTVNGGVVVFVFAGTLTVDGVSVSVNGNLVATPTANQPPSGGSYSISLDASVTSPRGDVEIATDGTVTLDDTGQVIDFDIATSLAVTPAGSPSSTVAVSISPQRFELVITGPLGNVMRFQLDRTTMSGELLLNGIAVASVTIVDGCATVQYSVPGVPDKTACSGS